MIRGSCIDFDQKVNRGGRQTPPAFSHFAGQPRKHSAPDTTTTTTSSAASSSAMPSSWPFSNYHTAPVWISNRPGEFDEFLAILASSGNGSWVNVVIWRKNEVRRFGLKRSRQGKMAKNKGNKPSVVFWGIMPLFKKSKNNLMLG